MQDDSQFNHERPTKQLSRVESSGQTVVGIGASAGGLAALKIFFDLVPADSGLTFVVVVHLPPDHKSHFADLLQSKALFPVLQVTETTLLCPNHVYVIPPNANINAVDTHLRLSNLEEDRARRAPIDHFFRTLAHTHDGHSIGVILTGTGVDGTLGIRQIKARGGVIIVQDPNEAEFDGMPQSAIATGLADLVLPLRDIPEAILKFNRTEPQVRISPDQGEADESDETLIQKIFVHLRVTTGRDFSHYKRSTAVRRIARRMQLNYIDDLPTYLQRVHDQPVEAKALADDLLVTVTNFFRDTAVFERLETEVIPRLFAGKEVTDSVRLWCVGCATGEEAYSLAMLLVEEAGKRDLTPQLQIFASDLHLGSLQRARDGFYAGNIEAEVSAERLKRFFVRENAGYRIRKDLRDLVVFAPHNLLGDPPFSRLDFISCRNLLIYLQRDMQRAVIDLFHYSLNPDGTLLLGSAETLETSDLFRAEDKKSCLYRKRSVPVPEPRLPVFPGTRIRLHREVEQKVMDMGEPITYGSFHQRMVELYAPPSILVSADNKLVHLSEHAGRFLVHPGGEPTANIFKLIREELRLELQGLLTTARDNGTSCDSSPTLMSLQGVQHRVVMHVRPARESAQEGFALILFEEREAAGPRSQDAVPDLSPEQRSKLTELEREVELSRERLRSIIEEYETSQEEMKASNEEMQSANEELRSTMEELETSKEELQSINEELQTVNQENRHKVEELAQLSGDLHNLLASTGIATLFLDRSFRIQRFTPKISELFSILMTDRGRPISDLTHRLGYPQLLSDAQQVLADLSTVEREVKDDKHRWYLTRVLPYRGADDRIEGVVITFVDITRRVEAEIALRESERQVSSELVAMQHLHDLVNRLVVSQDLPSALEAVLESSAEIMGSNMGNIQLVNPSSGALGMAAHRGIRDEHLSHFHLVATEPDAPCGKALRTRERVLVEDVAVDPLYVRYQEAATEIGYRSVQATPLVSRSGRLLGILSTHSALPHLPSLRNLRILDLYTRQAADFVERCQSEDALRQSQERYRLLVENAREYAIFMLDPEGLVATWSSGAERIFGYTEVEILGRHSGILFTQEDQQAGTHLRELEVAATEGCAADERWHQRKDGARFWASGVMERLDSAQGGYVKVLRDNSERKMAEEALREQERHLTAANKALSHANANLNQFAFAASHDLREPLRTIAAYVRVLIDATRAGRENDAEKATRFILQGTQRMDNLLNDLLTYTQLTVEEETSLESVDLNAVLDKALGNLNEQLEQSAAKLTRDVLPHVLGKESQCIQLFQNLLSNAIKYRSERPLEIQIRAEQVGDQWRIAVADNGIGIDPVYHEQVFGVFKRLHGSRIPGTGIGLAICRRVVERFGGRIWVESQAKQGSTFYVSLPASNSVKVMEATVN